jgi:Rrf2 family transcriptional regulator, iron-sulfur cluster assembly transcription factor
MLRGILTMMLTTRSRYAVMAVTEVASRNSQLPVKLADISEKQDIPLNYLEQIFLRLKKANLVRSVKGPGGGYCLNRLSSQIFIEDIIDAVEENLKMTRCSDGINCMKNGLKCKTHDLWMGLGDHIRKYFSNISVADVISGNIKIAQII